MEACLGGRPRGRGGGVTRRRESRLASTVTWIAIIAPLPYSTSRLLWAAGVPVGIDQDLLEDLDAPGWGSLYIVLLAALADVTALLTHVIVRPRARVVPQWVPVIGGRPVRPKLVIAALLLPTLVLTWRAALHLRLVFNGFRVPDDISGVPSWSLWTQAALVWIWAAALATALLAYHRATRPADRMSRIVDHGSSGA
jgi:hypothetical protein